ncbi:MAG: hypothetical protein MUF25_05090 [Pirellulaceae bacterium]|jgi:hypothetical protein|nr:hypothetical protein [Pirellulaceae bacterium]
MEAGESRIIRHPAGPNRGNHLDFAKRLKAHGRKRGKRFKTITKAHIVTSCRKSDTFGDWYLIRNPGFVWRIFTGKSQKDADDFDSDVQR